MTLTWSLGALLVGVVAVAGGPALADGASGLAEFRAGQFSEAFADWRQAADSGDAASALYLGVLFDTGVGVPPDPGQALHWYRRAGDGGNGVGMFNAAVMFDAGRGTARDPAEAARWYDRAARAGVARAEYNLALMVEGGDGGVPRDRARAVQLYRAAAEAGVTAARGRLRAMGVSFGQTLQAPPTEDPALAKFREAERLLLTRGTAEAERAAALFREAAERGNPLAAYDLAYCYEHGLGVAPSVERAVAWYRRSAAAANDDAVRQLAETGARNLLNGLSQVHR